MLKRFNLSNLFLTAFLTLITFSFAAAQNAVPSNQATNENAASDSANNRREFLIAELGFTPEQMREYRRINSEKRPLMRQAQQRLAQANRALDQAIYADAPDDAAIDARIADVQAAQGEVLKIRSLTEFAVRRILTAAQLTKFREARRRFEAAVEERRLDKKENRRLNQPNRRLLNRRRQIGQTPNN